MKENKIKGNYSSQTVQLINLLNAHYYENYKNNDYEKNIFKKEVLALIKKGADVNAKSKNGKTLLIDAILNKKNEIVLMLLKFGANPNLMSKEISPLILALYKDNFAVAKMLVVYNADVNLHTGFNSALEFSIKHDNFKAVEFLIKNSANPNLISSNGESMLYLACQVNNKKIIKLLLENGAKSFVQNAKDINEFHEKLEMIINELKNEKNIKQRKEKEFSN